MKTDHIFTNLFVAGSPPALMSNSALYSASPIGSTTPPGSKAASFSNSPTPPGGMSSPPIYQGRKLMSCSHCQELSQQKQANRLHKSEQPIKSPISKLTQLLILTTTHKLPGRQVRDLQLYNREADHIEAATSAQNKFLDAILAEQGRALDGYTLLGGNRSRCF